MTRKEFIRLSALLGISIPVQSLFTGCSDKLPQGPNSNNGLEGQKVIIVGAGPAGMTAGYLLAQAGVDFQILEATSGFGGRTKTNTTFTDFPIPLGAEWLHVERGIFDEVVNDSTINVTIETTPYDESVDYALFEGNQISLSDVGFTIDQKFINSSWLDFFKQYVIPSIEANVMFNKIVTEVDYSTDEVIVKTADEEFKGAKVIVTAPVKILQNQSIQFTPSLPNDKLEAINEIKVWDGCKAFIEFSEKFYPAVTAFDIQPASDGEKLYYDAAYGQNSDKHILGLFAVGTGTLPYVNLSDADLIAYMLNELDEIFEGKASDSYVKHLFQNWNDAPFANGAYATSYEKWQLFRTLAESVNDRLYFAGDAYTDGSDWSSVHTAARSAKVAVEELIG